eukprot:6361832-Pyramimonas_sp.AAC.1
MYRTPLEQVQLSPVGDEDHAHTVKCLQRELGDYFSGVWHQWTHSRLTNTGYVCEDPTKQDPGSCEDFFQAWHQHNCNPMDMDNAPRLRANWTIARDKVASRGK